MNPGQLISTSRFLSLVLRHAPEKIGLRLDDAGWVSVDQLLAALAAHRRAITREQLEYVVANNDKKRFAFSSDGRSIRASQGHSVEVDLKYAPAVPPDTLYHGTARRFLDAILREGLRPMGRRHVHLSAETETAVRVGQRHGKPVILEVAAARMHGEGLAFYLSDNRVWLTESVSPEFLKELH
jgi:putative RNA 2'-phosphotransferase